MSANPRHTSSGWKNPYKGSYLEHAAEVNRTKVQVLQAETEKMKALGAHYGGGPVNPEVVRKKMAMDSRTDAKKRQLAAAGGGSARGRGQPYRPGSAPSHAQSASLRSAFSSVRRASGKAAMKQVESHEAPSSLSLPSIPSEYLAVSETGNSRAQTPQLGATTPPSHTVDLTQPASFQAEVSTNPLVHGTDAEQFRTTRQFTGDYTCIACTPEGSSTWATTHSGNILVLNANGDTVTELPPLLAATSVPAGPKGSTSVSLPAPLASDSFLHADDQSEDGQRTARGAGSRDRDDVSVLGPASVFSFKSLAPAEQRLWADPSQAPGPEGTPISITAMYSTAAHMLVGHADGTVVFYDHLIISAVTQGKFHNDKVTSFCMLQDETYVSASADGSIVHWDIEERNFEAQRRIVCGAGDAAITAVVGPVTSRAPLSVVMCGVASGNIMTINCETGLQTALYVGHRAPVTSIAVFEDFLFSAAEDCVVNVWKVGSGRFVKSVRVGSAVCALHCHGRTRSLWVGYRSGLLERWSADPEDDFGVEQIVDEHVGRRLVSFQCIGAVETQKVLTLSSNGVNRVWCSHYNHTEEEMRQAISSLKSVISEDAREIQLWKHKASLAQFQFERRRELVVKCLAARHYRLLLLRYFERWRRQRLHAFRFTRLKHLAVEMRREYHRSLRRAYYSQWYRSHMLKKQRTNQYVHAVALAATTVRTATHRAFWRWKTWLIRRKATVRQCRIARLMQLCVEKALATRYLEQWLWCVQQRKRGIEAGRELAERLSNHLQNARRKHLLRQWEAVRSRQAARHFQVHLIAALERVNATRLMRGMYSVWQQRAQLAKVRQKQLALVELRVTQRRQDSRCRTFWTWMQLVYARRLEAQRSTLNELERDLHDMEAANEGLMEKLEERKKVDRLRQQCDAEVRKCEDTQKELARLIEQRDQLLQRWRPARQQMEHAASPPSVSPPRGVNVDILGEDDDSDPLGVRGREPSPVGPRQSALSGLRTTRVAAETQRRALQLLPDEASAISLVMAMLKARVLNLYTDLPMLHVVRQRVRKGVPPLTVFLEGHHEIKRIVVEVSRMTLLAKASRWLLTDDQIQGMPAHQCAALLTAIKTMTIAYDLMDKEARASVSVGSELVQNVDLLGVMARVAYTKRKPPLPSSSSTSKMRTS